MLPILLRMPHGPSVTVDPGGGDPGGGGPGVIPAFSPDFFASPTGSSSNDGSQLAPFDLQTVLNGGWGALAGRTVALRGGTYHKAGGWSTGAALVGNSPNGPRDPEGKIHIRSYPGERVIITDSIVCDQGSNYWLHDLEVRNTTTATTDKIGVNVHAPNVGLVCVRAYDHSGNGVSIWREGSGSFAEGCVVYNNGFTGSTPGTSYGHGFYFQNRAANPRLLMHGLVAFNNFGFGVHGYGEAADTVANYDLRGICAYWNGVKAGYDLQLGGGADLTGLIMRDFWSYRDGTTARIGYAGDSLDGDIQDCFFGGQVFRYNWSGGALTWKNNEVVADQTDSRTLYLDEQVATLDTSRWVTSGNRYGHVAGGFVPFVIVRAGGGLEYSFAAFKAQVGGETSSTFEVATDFGLRTLVLANEVDPSRANIFVRNPAGLSEVDVPADQLSSVMNIGDSYEIAHDYDWTRVVASGTYAGGDVTLPMTGHTPPAMLGGSLRGATPTNASPKFGSFRLTRSAT